MAIALFSIFVVEPARHGKLRHAIRLKSRMRASLSRSAHDCNFSLRQLALRVAIIGEILRTKTAISSEGKPIESFRRLEDLREERQHPHRKTCFYVMSSSWEKIDEDAD